jgi:hypothetical protein
MKELNSIETTFVKGSLRYKGADDIGLNSNVTLMSTQKEIEEYTRSPVIDLVALYDKERQKSAKYVPSAKFQFILYNAYSGLCSSNQGQIYEPFNNNLYYVNEEYYRSQSVVNGTQQLIPWGGYPTLNEFSFIRTDYSTEGYTQGVNAHVNFNKKIADKYNWYIQSTYVFSSTSAVTMSYEVDGQEYSFVCGNGIPYRMSPSLENGKRIWTFTCPVNHGLSVGEFVELDFIYNNTNVFEVFSTGNGYYDSEKKIFSVLDIGYTGTTKFFAQRDGQFKRILNKDYPELTKSRYYVRLHKILTNYTATTITNSGFEQNAFRNQRKRVIPATSPNINVESNIAVYKEGSQSYNVGFNGFVSLKNLIDNHNRPISELYYTIINRGYFGWFYPKRDLSTQSLRQGWEFNLGAGIIPTQWWQTTNSNSSAGIEFDEYDKTINGVDFTFRYTKELQVGDIIYGDFCEWNDFEQTERVVSDYYQKFALNQALFSINSNITNPFGYYYKVHNKVTLRMFSDYLEEKPAQTTSNVPNYAYYNSLNDTYLWKDLYPYGYIDADNIGVDYPFMNGKHYPYENFFFKIKPEGQIINQTQLTSVQLPTIDGCE